MTTHAKAATLLRETADELKHAHSLNGVWIQTDNGAEAAHLEIINTAQAIEQEAVIKAALVGHLLVLLDVVEDEDYESHHERRLAALSDLGASGALNATPTKADIAARLEHLASQMHELGQQMAYIGGFGIWARHGQEMQSAASVTRDWAESIRLELAGAPA